MFQGRPTPLATMEATNTVFAATAPTYARGGLPEITSSKVQARGVTPYAKRADVRAFIDKLVTTDHFDRAHVESLIFAITPPADVVHTDASESAPWWKYRAQFLNATLERMGDRFADENAKVLADVEKKYGVERRAILGIAGVETNYGSYTGNVPALQALVRLAFDDERRPDYFKDELEALFLLSRENGLDLKTLEGSSAGALGICQFMPSNYRRLGVSYSGHSKADLWSAPDASASIANYFKHFNARTAWHTGQPTAVAAHVKKAPPAELLNEVLPLETFRKNGITFSGTGNETTGRLIKMALKDGSFEYWIGLPNFETIRSYNPSNNYALAVAQLGEVVDAQSRHTSGAK
jgi:membrane-bound lytic murein transglycosylase B